MSSPSYSPTSTTSFGSYGFGSDSDELGLRTLGNFYAPHLYHDIERLFLRGTSGTASPTTNHNKSVWEEFENNGQDTDLDELDRLFRGMDHHNKQPSPIPSVTTDSVSIDSHSSTPSSGMQQAMVEILSKANLIEILRERERLQRLKPKNSKKKLASAKVCVFCRNNGEAETVYMSHQLKDPEGNVTCPVLYIYTCPICGASGKSSHTIKYCPYNTGDPLYVAPLTCDTNVNNAHNNSSLSSSSSSSGSNAQSI